MNGETIVHYPKSEESTDDVIERIILGEEFGESNEVGVLEDFGLGF